MRLEDYLIRNAGNYPHDTALIDSRRRVDYLELLAECQALASALRQRGLNLGDRVAVISPNRIEFIVSAFACFLGGYVFQPINFRLSESEVTNILDNAEPSAVLIDGAAFPHHVELIKQRANLLTYCVFTDKGAEYNWSDGSNGLPDSSSFEKPLNPPTTAALLYTSGTTGTPKGTILSHKAWVHSSRDGAYALRLTRHDVSYQCIPLFHVSFCHFLSTFYCAVPTILSERVRPAEIVDAIINQKATHTTLIQAALVDLLNYLEKNDIQLPQLTNLQYGGSPIAPAVIEKLCALFGNVLHQNYGMTESGGASTYLPPEDHSESSVGEKWLKRVTSAGYAMPGVEIGIFDDAGNLLAANISGEIRIRSEGVMDGYWRNEAATKEVLLEGGWLATGDIGSLDEDGYVYILDRKKDMIISGGENIYARDVEDTLLSHPEIIEAAVVGGPHERLGEQVVAFVVLREGSEISEQLLLEWLGTRLATYKKPRLIYFEESLPRTAVQKVHKPTLRAKLKLVTGAQT